MDNLAHRYAAWKAPQEDRSVLLWPEPDELFADARDNNASLASAQATIQNTPLPELRRQLRRFLNIHDDRQLVFATGHQSELHHPGVWAKNLLIDAAATKTGGLAMHVAVDTDAPKHLSLRFPGYSRPFTDDPALVTAEWAQLIAPPTPAHLAALSDDIAAADWPFAPAIHPLFDTCRRLSLKAEHLPHMLTAALHEFDWSLGLRYSVLLASPIWLSPPFLALAHHLMANADRFAADYNHGLRRYRERNGIRTPGRPMPELAIKSDTSGSRCETAFWRDDQTRGRRVRAWVERSNDAAPWTLCFGEDCLELDPSAPADVAADRLIAFLRRHNLRIAPRALTLTMALRLLLADQFVHGIGGGQYDQVTDEIIARHFGIDPPRFSVSTATLYWPTAAGRERTSIPRILQEGHRLKHSVLGPRKLELVAAIANAPRRSIERQHWFQQLQNELASAAKRSEALMAWQEKLRGASAKVAEERATFDREIFYALQPGERLSGLIQGYRAKF